MCNKKCPVFAIEGEKKAQHHINPLRCVDCGVCGKICPKKAVLDNMGVTLSRLPRSEWEKPVVDKTLCCACNICVDICRFHCFEISPPAFTGDINAFARLKDSDACVGCGLCAADCPLKAIKLQPNP
jgi:Pyruvate/2-oxoacid:ferredoxin oxidoreductase delta subunit